MMGTWIWPLRPIMLEKAQWTAPTVFRHFAKLGTTYKKYRMPISAQDRDVLMDCGLIHGPSTRTWNPPAASYSRTNKEPEGSAAIGNPVAVCSCACASPLQPALQRT